jgi:hypothetical protein
MATVAMSVVFYKSVPTFESQARYTRPATVDAVGFRRGAVTVHIEVFRNG